MTGSHGNRDHPTDEFVPRASDVDKAWLGDPVLPSTAAGSLSEPSQTQIDR